MPTESRSYPRNILLIETDQQRHDTVGALGNPHMITPSLDRLNGTSNLPQIGRPNGTRRIWPGNHPEDPYVLHPGSIGNNIVKL